MNDRLKAIAFAVLTVIAAYFLATAFGKLGGNTQYFLPLDILVYLGIGFFSAGALGDWRDAFVVVAGACIIAKRMSPLGAFALLALLTLGSAGTA